MIENHLLEESVLFEAKHPFICSMEYSFQTDNYLYFVMPYLDGGDLNKLLDAHRRFPEQFVKFFVTQIVIALG